MEKFKGKDEVAMVANNTSAFNCHPVSGSHQTFPRKNHEKQFDLQAVFKTWMGKTYQ